MRNALLAMGIVLVGVSANLGLLNVGGDPQATSAKSVSIDAAQNPKREKKSPTGRSDSEVDNNPIMKLYEVDDANNAYYKSGVLEDICSRSTSKSKAGPAYCMPPFDPQGKAETLEPWGTLRNRNVDFLIATVPDPAETRLTVLFDRTIESILAAAADHCYAFDRFWTPWQQSPYPLSDDPVKRAKVAAEEAELRGLPGILIFRGEWNTDELRRGKTCGGVHELPQALAEPLEYDRPPILAVFLVGETPTGGVNQQQLFRSIYYTEAMGLPDRLGGILGPMFSGSFHSLHRVLEDAAVQFNSPAVRQLQIVSGSVTGDPPNDLKFENFRPMLSQDVFTLKFVNSILTDRVVMVLNEEGTTYGRNIASTGKEDVGKTVVLHASYPRDISTLRNALQEAPRGPANISENTRAQISLTLRDAESGLDSVPRFATAQSPITQDAVLLHLAESIRREAVETVVITATNVLDTLLLTRFLRNACPDVRIVTFDSDLLFVHGSDSADYAGSLAAVSHPLTSEVLGQSNPVGFSKVGSPVNGNIGGGIFTAFEALIKKVDPKLRESNPSAYAPDRWLTLVGRGLYWPVAMERGDRSRDPKFDARRPTMAGYVFYVGVGIGALLFAGLYGFAVTLGRKRSWCAELLPGGRVYHVIANMAILIALCVIAYAPAYLAHHQQSGWRWIALWLGVATAACLAATVHALGDKKWRLLLGVPCVTLIVGLGIWICTGPTELEDATLREYFRAVRSADPASGVAPNVPIVLLLFAVAVWAWINKRRLILAERRDPRVEPLKGLPSDVFSSLTDSLRRPLLLKSRWACVAGAATVGIVVLLHPYLRMLESDWYGQATLLLTAVVFGLIAISALGLIQIWLALRRLLQAFDGHQIREAFTRLPAVRNWSPLWPDQGSGTNAGLYRLRDSLTMLRARFSDYYAGMGPQVDELQGKIKELAERSAQGAIADPAVFQGFRKIANKIVSNLSDKLDSSVWSAGASESLDKFHAMSGKGQPPESAGTATASGASGAAARPALAPTGTADILAAEVVAIRYVAFIRYVILQIKNQITVLTVGFVLTVIALNSYPFQGAGFLRWWITGAALLLGLIVVDIFAQMEKDATLSRLTDRQQGNVGREFYLKVISAGAIPLLAAVASHFPSVGRLLFSWLQPALTGLR